MLFLTKTLSYVYRTYEGPLYGNVYEYVAISFFVSVTGFVGHAASVYGLLSQLFSTQ